jgi:hypothetical protein
MKAIDPGPMVKVDPDTLTGDALNWAAFIALYAPAIAPTAFKVESSNIGSVTFPGGVHLAYSNGNESIIWEPETNAEQADKLIDGYLIGSRKNNTIWYAMASNDMGTGTSVSWSKMTIDGGKRYGPLSYEVHKRQQRFDDRSRLVASLRAAVAYHAYRTDTPVTVPAMLLVKDPSTSLACD